MLLSRLLVLSFLFAAGGAGDLAIRFEQRGEYRVEVYAGDELFTAYRYDPELQKPVLYPVLSPGGHGVTRAFPLETGVEGESRDHPHHQSISLTFGDLNGINFWARGGEMPSGRIRHTGLEALQGGPEGTLKATAEWVGPDGRVLLKQDSHFVFQAKESRRRMDLTYRLTAQNQPVVFNDTKEGMFSVRLHDSLRESQTGRYLNDKGEEKETGVWGKRSAWLAVRGQVEGEPLTLVVLNHPQSTRFPTHWHARGYGLMAANPFGGRDFEPDSEPIRFTLQPGESAVFGYRILIAAGELDGDAIRQEFAQYGQTRLPAVR